MNIYVCSPYRGDGETRLRLEENSSPWWSLPRPCRVLR